MQSSSSFLTSSRGPGPKTIASSSFLPDSTWAFLDSLNCRRVFLPVSSLFSVRIAPHMVIFFMYFQGRWAQHPPTMPSSSSLLVFSFSLQLLFKEYICEQCPEISQDVPWCGIFYLFYFGGTLCGCFQCRMCSWIYYLMISFLHFLYSFFLKLLLFYYLMFKPSKIFCFLDRY